MAPLSRLTFTCGILFTACLMISTGSCGRLKGRDEIGLGIVPRDGKSTPETLSPQSNQVEYDHESFDYPSSSYEQSESNERNQGLHSRETETEGRSASNPMVECRSNNDCSSHSCCSLGMTRYAVATCLPLGASGDACIPENVERNFTLTYPNGNEVEVLNAFRITCPCQQDYFCEKSSATCRKISQ